MISNYGFKLRVRSSTLEAWVLEWAMGQWDPVPELSYGFLCLTARVLTRFASSLCCVTRVGLTAS